MGWHVEQGEHRHGEMFGCELNQAVVANEIIDMDKARSIAEEIAEDLNLTYKIDNKGKQSIKLNILFLKDYALNEFIDKLYDYSVKFVNRIS